MAQASLLRQACSWEMGKLSPADSLSVLLKFIRTVLQSKPLGPNLPAWPLSLRVRTTSYHSLMVSQPLLAPFRPHFPPQAFPLLPKKALTCLLLSCLLFLRGPGLTREPRILHQIRAIIYSILKALVGWRVDSLLQEKPFSQVGTKPTDLRT